MEQLKPSQNQFYLFEDKNRHLRGLRGQRLDSTKSCALENSFNLFAEFETADEGLYAHPGVVPNKNANNKSSNSTISALACGDQERTKENSFKNNDKQD